MSGIASATVVLLFISCLIALSTAADYSWIVLDEINPEYRSPDLNRTTSHELLLKLLSKKNERQLGFEMRSEIYTMATGKDFYRLVADDNENKEFHAIAEACLTLSQKLTYMEAVSNILRTAFRNGASSVVKTTDITKGLPAVKETIEKLMQDSPALNEEYKRLKSEALAQPLPADYKIYYYEIPQTLDEAKSIVAITLNNPFLKKLMVDNIFISELRNASSPESQLLVKTILKLAKDPEVDVKVQTLYDEAVAETTSQIEDVSGKNVDETYLKEKFIRVGIKFFQTLSNKFGNDSAIKTKVAETKAEISKSR